MRQKFERYFGLATAGFGLALFVGLAPDIGTLLSWQILVPCLSALIFGIATWKYFPGSAVRLWLCRLCLLVLIWRSYEMVGQLLFAQNISWGQMSSDALVPMCGFGLVCTMAIVWLAVSFWPKGEIYR